MKTPDPRRVTTRHRGFSLIELMVAIVLSTVLIGGAASLYLVSKTSYVEVEQAAAVAENARFSMQVLNRALRHVGFFGPVGFIDSTEIDTSAVDGTAITGDCTGQAAALDTSTLIFAVDLGGSDTSLFDCIDDARPGTDVLVVKFLEPSPVYDSDPADDPLNPLDPPDGVLDFPDPIRTDSFYIAANSEQAMMFFGGTAADVPDVGAGELYANAVAYPYALNVFYVREDITTGIPRLSRKTLEWNGTAMQVVTEDLVEGVENLQFLFGEDTDSPADGVPNVFVSSDLVTDWNSVVTARAFALTRSLNADSDYTDTRTYTVGDTTWTPSCTIIVAGGFNECQFRRLLVQTDINLRNPKFSLRRPI
jgi:type IV pilus assembly protein PilW